MTAPHTRIVYAFDRFRVDPQQRLLFADSVERAVPLPPRVFDTLLHFIERPGELLSKRALMRAVWPNLVVEENGLNQSISLLRRSLGETPGDHRFIVTIPRRGYRFVAKVQEIDPS
jgi:DNA-binding winged helix-turn-helix (wHTH) protein